MDLLHPSFLYIQLLSDEYCGAAHDLGQKECAVGAAAQAQRLP
mgnify:CR=1 FL=1